MLTDKLHTMLAQWFPRLRNGVQDIGADAAKQLNVSMGAIPIDPKQYDTTDEFSFILKPSTLSGVGVFCTHGIAKGTRLLLFPHLKNRYFSNKQLERDPRLKAFCQVYGVETGRGSVVARNFCYMHIGWYLNHCDEPNAHHERFRWIASRDIEADEEITIDYRELYR